MELWIIIALVAAFFQNVRSAVQKRLSGDLGAQASAYTRFVFALPFALVYLISLYTVTETQVPEINIPFLIYIVGGGSAQILGTTFLIKSFEGNQFAQGTAFSKTEVLQTAVIGFVLLGESVGLYFTLGVFISLIGVLGLIGFRNIVGEHTDGTFRGRVALLGIGAGAGFALSAVAYRGAALALVSDLGGEIGNTLDSVHRAAFTLACVLGFQTLGMGIYLFIKHRAGLRALLRQWRAGLAVGLAGMLASTGWFTALAMQSAAFVRALGQVELIFAMLTSVFLFKEGLKRNEVFSILILSFGILVIVLAG